MATCQVKGSISNFKFIFNRIKFVYSYLRYGIAIFYHCSFTWRAKLNSILKSVLQNVAYNETIPPNNNLFSFLQLPSFDALFFQTVVIKHFWNSDFLFPLIPVRPLRHHNKFTTPWCYTRFGRYTRKYYVPNVFNSLPTELYSISSKRTLKQYLKTNFFFCLVVIKPVP